MPLSCASPEPLADAPPVDELLLPDMPVLGLDVLLLVPALGAVLPEVEPLLMLLPLAPEAESLFGVLMLPLLLDEAPPETDPLAPDESPGELDVPDVVPVLPGDAAGVPDPCASRLHASKSPCVGSAASAALLIMHMPATVSIAVARVNFFISVPSMERRCFRPCSRPGRVQAKCHRMRISRRTRGRRD